MRALSLIGLLLFPLLTLQGAPKNIVLLMADDLGQEALSISGSASTETPHLDQLAQDGVRFLHAYAQPLCTPSRVKIMTGLSNRRNYRHFGYLDVQAQTFAQDLATLGYHTGIVGKWQLNGRTIDSELEPLTRPRHFGFETWRLWQLADSGRLTPAETGLDKRIDARYANPVLNTDGDQLGPLMDEYGPELCLEWAIERIEEWSQSDRPFFLYFPMILTHSPFYPTPLSEEWAEKEARLSSGGQKQKFFADMVGYTDHIVGELRQTLDRLNLGEDTWLMFTGDNGTDQGITTTMRSGEVVRGGKSKTINRGHHVPFVAWREGVADPGRVSDELIDFADLCPTIWDLAEIPDAERRPTDGVSFAAELEAIPNDREKSSVYIFYSANKVPAGGSHESESSPAFTEFVRDQRFKLYGDGRFFDVVEDPEETSPLNLEALPDEARLTLAEFRIELEKWQAIPDGLTQ
ncbi:MAG: sulfatase-like hydrolase/transferase [Verrucomicrobiota bacterium]